MNKKKVDSILKGITAAGIAMGGVSSIQGADMVMAAINESAADSNSLVDAGSFDGRGGLYLFQRWEDVQVSV